MAHPARSDQRSNPRASVVLQVRLERKAGSPLTVQTVDVSAGGARVLSERPLRIDEQLHFDVDLPERCHLDGTARVLRQDRHNVYALRFEGCPAAMLEELRAFVAASTQGTVH